MERRAGVVGGGEAGGALEDAVGPTPSLWISPLLLMVVHLGAAKAGLLWNASTEVASPLSLGAGVALVGVQALGWRGVLAVLAALVIDTAPTASGWGTGIGTVLGEVGGAMLGGFLLRRPGVAPGGPWRLLESPRGVVVLFAAGAAPSAVVSAGIGNLGLVADGAAWSARGVAAWGQGEVLGVLFAAPILLALTRGLQASALLRAAPVAAVPGAAAFGMSMANASPEHLWSLVIAANLAPALLRAPLGGALGLPLTVAGFAAGMVWASGTWADGHASVVGSQLELACCAAAALLVSGVVCQRDQSALLEESEQRLRTALEAGRMGTWMWEPETGRCDWSTETYAALGYAPGEAAPAYAAWLSRVHPEDRAGAEAAVQAAMSGAQSLRLEFRCVRPDGGVGWCEARGRAKVNPATGRRALQGVVLDISERKAAERALGESEARFRSVSNQSPTIIWVKEADGRMSFVSQAWETLTGVPAESAMRAGLLEAVHPDDRERVIEICKGAFGARAPGELDCRLRRRDGAWAYVVSRWTPRFSATGEYLGQVGSLTDITERRQAEEALARSHDELESLVAARTRELERAQAAARLNERMASLGTLAQGLSHDLNNLLLPLRELVDGLATEPGMSSRAMGDLRKLRGLAEYLSALARGLRLFSRDPSGPAEAECTNLAAWWIDAQPFLRACVPAGVGLGWEGEPPAIDVAIAPHRLSQAVHNLIHNAGDALAAAGRAGGAVRVAAARIAGEEDGPAMVRLTVTDGGVGMTDEVRTRCLEPFYTTKPRLKGTGLGLSIVHGIATSSGGRVEIESEAGRGSAVSIVVPVAMRPSPGAAGHPVRARVRVADGRAAAFARAVLRTAGAVAEEEGAGDEELLVLDGEAWAREQSGGGASVRGRERVRLVVVVGGGRGAGGDAEVRVLPPEADLAELRPLIMAGVQAARANRGAGARTVLAAPLPG